LCIVESFAEVGEIVPDIENILSQIVIVIFISEGKPLQFSTIKTQAVKGRPQFYNRRCRDTETPDGLDASENVARTPGGASDEAEPPDADLLAMAMELAIGRLRHEFGYEQLVYTNPAPRISGIGIDELRPSQIWSSRTV
jgi:hypothetical protein